jgi:hypothetical protein
MMMGSTASEDLRQPYVRLLVTNLQRESIPIRIAARQIADAGNAQARIASA